MAEIFIVQNISTNEIEIKDFGILLPAAASIELENFDQAVLSDEVLNHINNNNLIRLIDGSIAPSNKIFSFTNQLYLDLLLESSLGFGIKFDSSSAKFIIDSSEFITTTKFDASINDIVTLSSSEFLNESSLGPQFYYQDGSLFVIDISGGSGDVTLAYVDGSLAARDISIANIEASLGDYVRKDGDTMSGKLSFNHDSSGDIAGNISGGQHGTLNLDSSLGIILNSPYLVIPEASSYVGDFLTIGAKGILNYTSLNQPKVIWSDVISAPFNIINTLETSILSITLDQDVSFGSSFYYTELDLPWWRDIWFRIYKNGLLFLEELFTGGPGLTTFSDSNPVKDEGIPSGSILEITVQSNIANYSVEAGEANITKYGNNVTAEWGSITGDINNQTDLQAQRTADRIYVDSSLNNKADLSYVNQTFLRESSLGTDFIWNTGLLEVSIGVGVSQAYVDGSLAVRDISINNNYQNIIQLDSSISIIDIYNSIQDISIANLEASLGNYVLKAGDIMTGNLQVPSLTSLGDVSLNGSIYSKGSINPGGVLTTGVFPISITAGDLFFRKDLNQMFLYDASRGKWLSIDRATYTAGSNRITSGTTGYFDVGKGTMSSATGFRMPKNGTILGASIQNRSNVTVSRQMSIRINDVSSYSLTIPISNPGGVSGINGNSDFIKDDIIQIVLESGGSTMRDIQASFEVAWRE